MTIPMGGNQNDDWESSYDRRISLLARAAYQGNTQYLAELKVEDESNVCDFNQLVVDDVDQDLKDTYREMGTHLQGENEQTHKDTEDVKEKMEKLKNDKNGMNDWEHLLNDTIDKGIQDSKKRWEALRQFGKEKIGNLRQEWRNEAAKRYTAALQGVSMFMSQAIKWLRDAWNTLEKWIKKAWAMVTEWANKTTTWFKAAVDTVAAALGVEFGTDDSKEPGPNRSDGPSTRSMGIGGLDGIVKKLLNLNLDKIVLVKKSSGWVMELPI